MMESDKDRHMVGTIDDTGDRIGPHNDMRPSDDMNPRDDMRPRDDLRGSAWLAMPCAVLCTLGVFLFLPLSQWISDSAEPPETVRVMEAPALVPPLKRRPPPPVPLASPKIIEPKPEPRLELPPEPPRLIVDSLPLSLRGSPGNIEVNLDLDFDVDLSRIEVVTSPVAEVPEIPAVPEVYEIGEVDRKPQPLYCPEPAYPRSARRRGVEGHVMVRFTVDARGRVEEVRVVESEPKGVFDGSALRAVKGWRFEPAVKDEIPVAVTVETDLHFSIEGRR